MKREITREKGGRFCRLEITWEDGRLSICGAEGRVVTRKAAASEALEYWRGFFEDSPDELREMEKRNDVVFRSPLAAAKYVVRIDGEHHGLDVTGDGRVPGTLLLTESWGQIREALANWFPEVAPHLKWHLNDMHAECEHQEARGETWVTHPGAVCPDCGYKLGSAWTKRAVPGSVIAALLSVKS